MSAPPLRLTSAANPLLKDVRQAVRRGGLTADGLAVVESPRLLVEARRSRLAIEAVLVAESAFERDGPPQGSDGLPVRIVDEKLFRQIASTATSQGVITLAQLPEWDFARLFESERPVVILDGLQDPGNVGAVVRSAEAFGAGGVVFAAGTASPFHPKTLRASAGSLFRVPFVHRENPRRIVAACAERDFRLMAASAHVGDPIGEVDFTRSAVVIGAEGRGVHEEFMEDAAPIRIPTDRVESLNAAMAATVILWEAARRASARPVA